MSKLKTLVIGCALSFACVASFAQTPSYPPGFWSTPTIPGYGRMHMPDNPAYMPNPSHIYKIVFAVTQASKTPSDVNGALDHVARTVNLYVAAGVPLKNLKFVVIVGGAAAPAALDDAHYREKFGIPNPNLQLISELEQAGVHVAVCGQAVPEHHFDYNWIDPKIKVALSELTTVTVLQQQGYALLPQ
jgi:intracellular sulfur oxidation DsrE/DsrF family protein